MIFIAFCFFLWARSKRENIEDPRLSRGLQIVSSKIAILEDLSKQVDVQSQQISAFLDQKSKQVLETLEKSDDQLNKIELAQQKSLQIAEIFQDRIPHEEIRQREQAKKYVLAAKMAFEGHSTEDIQQALALSRAEIEMISKVNTNLAPQDLSSEYENSSPISSSAEISPPARSSEQDQLKALSEKFKKVPQMLEAQSGPKGSSPVFISKISGTSASSAKEKRIQPVQFPRIY
jgi:hypothetical protein